MVTWYFFLSIATVLLLEFSLDAKCLEDDGTYPFQVKANAKWTLFQKLRFTILIWDDYPLNFCIKSSFNFFFNLYIYTITNFHMTWYAWKIYLNQVKCLFCDLNQTVCECSKKILFINCPVFVSTYMYLWLDLISFYTCFFFVIYWSYVYIQYTNNRNVVIE